MHAWWALTALCVATGACVLLDFDGYEYRGAGGDGEHSGGTGGVTTTMSTTTTTTGPLFGTPDHIEPDGPVMDVAAIGDAVYWVGGDTLSRYTLGGTGPVSVTATASLTLTVDNSHGYLAWADTGSMYPLERFQVSSLNTFSLALTFQPNAAPSDMVRVEDKLIVAAGDEVHWVNVPAGTYPKQPMMVGLALGHLVSNGLVAYGFTQDPLLVEITAETVSLVAPESQPQALAVNSTTLFVARSDVIDAYSITAFSSAAVPTKLNGFDALCLAADDDDLFYVDSSGVLGRVPVDGGGTPVVLDGYPLPGCRELLLTSDALFVWYEAGGQLVGVPLQR